ncbi:MAG: proline dehydrogenase family protein [Candidatus Marsarchaeota archaeon]|jgi:proline dehydrogenase|nr:proline dehydrogenase family protein [Candidatus Marsarchaeota archaeon]
MGAFVQKIFAGRWIAGPYRKDAIERARKFNSVGIGAIINYLGEDFVDKSDIDDAVSTYIDLIEHIESSGVRASISVKPTQIGLLMGRKLAMKNYSKIVKSARQHNVFVWLDMEAHEYVDDTIRLYESEVHDKGVGICIQSYLRRSYSDVINVVRDKGIVRLVKGAYKENETIAYMRRSTVTKNYLKLMRYVFRNSEEFMIATHDKNIIRDAINLNKKYGKKMHLAMLNGITDDCAMKIADEELSIWLYIPFGNRWIDYAYRRLREGNNAKLLVESIFKAKC